MRDSDVAVPAAIALAVAAPVLVGVLVAPTPAREPPPATGSLTVRHTQDSWWPQQDTDLDLLVLATGAPPTTASLTSASGQVAVDVRAAAGRGSCDGRPALASGAGPDAWCLTLRDVPAGAEVTGTVKGAAASVALTVSSRPAFLAAPLLAAVGGFLLAALLSFLASPLQQVVKRGRVRRLAADNRMGEASRRITGLQDWVEHRLSAGADLDELITQVTTLAASAPDAAQQARATLTAAVHAADELPADHPLRAVARREAERRDLKVHDFVDDEGEDAVHPARSVAYLLEQTASAVADLADIESRIDTHLKEPCRAGPTLQLRWARRAAAAVVDTTTLTTLQQSVQDARTALREALARPSCVAAQVGTLAASGGPERQPAPPLPEHLAAGSTRVSLRGPVLATGLVVAALLVVAMASVAAGTYAAKPAFGTGWDYLATALAGFGSGSAATVASTLAFWRSTGP